MVRYFNRNLKSHTCEKNETLNSIIDLKLMWELSQLLAFHLRDFGSKSHQDMTHLLQKTTIQLNIQKPGDLDNWYNHPPKIKEFFLFIDLIMETYLDSNTRWLQIEYIVDFVNDLNDFFLINKIPLQLRFIYQKREFYIENIISPEISEEIKNTLENFSKEEKVFEDFKESIKKYSSEDYEGSIEKCCVSIEDYLCIILGKETCSSVDSYYKDASKKLKIPDELDNRFTNLVHYIHKYRSPQNHGSLEKIEIPEPELTTQVIIQFTMAILNYLKKKKEGLK